MTLFNLNMSLSNALHYVSAELPKNKEAYTLVKNVYETKYKTAKAMLEALDSLQMSLSKHIEAQGKVQPSQSLMLRHITNDIEYIKSQMKTVPEVEAATARKRSAEPVEEIQEPQSKVRKTVSALNIFQVGDEKTDQVLTSRASVLKLREGQTPPTQMSEMTNRYIEVLTTRIANPVLQGLIRGYIKVRLPDKSQDTALIKSLFAQAQEVLIELPEEVSKRLDPLQKALQKKQLNDKEISKLMETLVHDFATIDFEVQDFLGMMFLKMIQIVTERPTGFPEDKKACCQSALSFIKQNSLWKNVSLKIVTAKTDGSFVPCEPQPINPQLETQPSVEQACHRLIGRIPK